MKVKWLLDLVSRSQTLAGSESDVNCTSSVLGIGGDCYCQR